VEIDGFVGGEHGLCLERRRTAWNDVGLRCRLVIESFRELRELELLGIEAAL
jgi:hypothetical protein